MFEETMLKALADFSDPDGKVVTPRLLMFDQSQNTQILEDYPGTVDLTRLLRTWSNADDIHIKSRASSIGFQLGLWLRSFHSWTSEPNQADLRKAVSGNQPMQLLKEGISYGSFMTILETLYPQLLDGTREKLERVRDMAAREFHTPGSYGDGDNWGIIHGDFWSGKYLTPEQLDPVQL